MIDKTDFDTKVTNILVQYLTGIMKNDISPVYHFLKRQPKEYAESIITSMKDKNRRKMFDELNISNIIITDTREENNNTIYDVVVDVKYMDYEMDINTGKVSGNNHKRILKKFKLKIIKCLNTRKQDHIRRCPSCGHSLDVSANGKCEYCNTIYNQEDYDYQILEIKIN
ncbi:MAG: hypothetical protein IKQ06_03955 [Bacilli bacterium]|nr:hypothetical protein [Bacilli bacterium]